MTGKAQGQVIYKLIDYDKIYFHYVSHTFWYAELSW